MQVAHLTEYGVPGIVVDSWREKLGEELLPVQKRAVVDFQVLSGKSLLIAAPTSSGKTFCGELAAVAAVFKRKKALFIVPLKSIAEERHADFRARYSGLGIRVAISTADRKEYDADLEQGGVDIGILVYEKFNQLLVKNIDLLASVDLLLIDEVQMISEPVRGWCLELALLKVLNSGYQPQIIALSAVLSDAALLAQWLGCRLLEDHYRPVELREGVLWNGQLRYRDFNGRNDGSEPLSEYAGDDAEELLLANVEHLVNSGEQVLVFLKTKRNCEQLATALAQRNFWSPAEMATARIKSETGSVLGGRLEQTLLSAVAFHHADLSYTQRRILEEGFRIGEIRALVSTTTLAMGVNLPAQTVFIDCYKYQTGSRSGRPMVTPLSWSEYEGMSGRAGRYGISLTPNPSPGGRGEKVFGRSVLIAGSRAEAETMWQTYVEGKPGRLESRLATKSLYDVVLDLIASRCARRSDDVGMLLLKSFHCLQGGSFNGNVIATVIDKLAELKLVFIKDGDVEASPIGALISRRGVGVASGMMMVSFCRRYQICDRLSWLYFTLSLPDANVLPVYLSRDEESCACYRRRLCDYVAANAAVSDELRKMVVDDYVLSCEQNVRLKAAFLLLEWIGEKETAGIEQDYHINLGSILQVAETTAWLLDTAAGVTALLNRPRELTGQLRQLAEAINRGFDLADTDLGNAGLAAEQRDIVWRLFNAGIASARDFCDGNRDRITTIAGEELADRLIERFATKHEDDKQSSQEVEMSQLRLRGLMRGDRVYFNFKNTEIDITPKSYNYLYKLTVARFLKPEGWLSKDEIEPGFNQAKNIYRVKQELKRFATGLEQRIENNGSGFYRINLSLEQIKIDFDSMKAFCDLELAELTKQVEGQNVC
ncbi:MAG: DEAD/DEAH box helicase [Candidatus Zixiibacteriota bacterium]|nr:MAG: DEAD/DEAH box helicase [candidate division Zixibacteria bacterium]